jgi:hypothetical protein
MPPKKIGDGNPASFWRRNCHEYCNTLGWFYDSFEHPQRLKLLYSAASFLNRNAWHQKNIGVEGPMWLSFLPAPSE